MFYTSFQNVWSPNPPNLSVRHTRKLDKSFGRHVSKMVEIYFNLMQGPNFQGSVTTSYIVLIKTKIAHSTDVKMLPIPIFKLTAS